MNNKKSTKRALLSSVLSLVLCMAMLIGTTFAWFTDSVTSGRNVIQSGNLDVELEYWDGTGFSKVTADTKLFNDAARWEPGYTEVAYLKISNLGSLALKYQLAVNVYNETTGKAKDNSDITLSDYLVFKVLDIEESTVGTYTRDTARSAAGNEMGLESYNSGTKALNKTNATDYVALVVYMPTTVGNEANHDGTNVPSIEMGVTLVATQNTYEKDSFNELYDESSVYPVPVGENGANFDYNYGFSFNIPKDAVAGGVTSVVPNVTEPVVEEIIPEDTSGTLKHSISMDISMEGIKEDNTTPITVNYVVPGNEDYVGVEVYHKGNKVDNATYDANTRMLTFTVTTFSPFEFVFDIGATVIPETYTNDEAIAMLTNAKDGAIIDGNGRTITFADNVANEWSFLIQNGVTFRNMTLKAKGQGATVMVYGKNKTIKMKAVTFQNTTYGKKALEISTNSRTSLVFEDCVIKGKPYVQGTNVTFTRCSFNTNMNLEAATNITMQECNFTVSGAITMNGSLKNILIQNCEFKYGNAIRLYSGMPKPTNVQLINNKYNTRLVQPDSGVDYAGWMTNGAWIEEGNTKL